MSDVSKSQQKSTKVSELTATQRAFVIARAHGKTIAQAAEDAGINRSTPAKLWDMDLINQAIAEIQQTWIANPNDALQALLPIALEKLKESLSGGRFEAVQEVLNRVWGKPVQRSELTGANGGPIEVHDAGSLTDDELLAIASRGSAGTA